MKTGQRLGSTGELTIIWNDDGEGLRFGVLFGAAARCQVLRDGYSMLKNLYRESWLRENRPFWLDNVLVGYDLRIQLRQKRDEELNTLINDWPPYHPLPTAAEAGLPAPPS